VRPREGRQRSNELVHRGGGGGEALLLRAMRIVDSSQVETGRADTELCIGVKTKGSQRKILQGKKKRRTTSYVGGGNNSIGRHGKLCSGPKEGEGKGRIFVEEGEEGGGGISSPAWNPKNHAGKDNNVFFRGAGRKGGKYSHTGKKALGWRGSTSGANDA